MITNKYNHIMNTIIPLSFFILAGFYIFYKYTNKRIQNTKFEKRIAFEYKR